MPQRRWPGPHKRTPLPPDLRAMERNLLAQIDRNRQLALGNPYWVEVVKRQEERLAILARVKSGELSLANAQRLLREHSRRKPGR